MVVNVRGKNRSIQNFYTNILNAVVHRNENIDQNVVDYRYYKKKNGVLSCICGCIEKIAVELVNQLQRDLMIHYCKGGWYIFAVKGDNPVVKGFAYELYRISQFIRRRPSARVFRFMGNYPVQIDQHERLTIYWPVKWNLRYVDFVTREVLKFAPQTGKGRKRKKTEKRDNTAHPVTAIITAYQVTLSAPTTHTNSLEFYTTAHNEGGRNLADYERYQLPGETAQHRFVWMIPHSTNSTLPAYVNLRSSTDTAPDQTVEQDNHLVYDPI